MSTAWAPSYELQWVRRMNLAGVTPASGVPFPMPFDSVLDLQDVETVVVTATITEVTGSVELYLVTSMSPSGPFGAVGELTGTAVPASRSITMTLNTGVVTLASPGGPPTPVAGTFARYIGWGINEPGVAGSFWSISFDLKVTTRGATTAQAMAESQAYPVNELLPWTTLIGQGAFFRSIEQSYAEWLDTSSMERLVLEIDLRAITGSTNASFQIQTAFAPEGPWIAANSLTHLNLGPTTLVLTREAGVTSTALRSYLRCALVPAASYTGEFVACARVTYWAR